MPAELMLSFRMVLRSANCQRFKIEGRGVAFSEVRFNSGAVPATVMTAKS